MKTFKLPISGKNISHRRTSEKKWSIIHIRTKMAATVLANCRCAWGRETLGFTAAEHDACKRTIYGAGHGRIIESRCRNHARPPLPSKYRGMCHSATVGKEETQSGGHYRRHETHGEGCGGVPHPWRWWTAINFYS